MPDSTYSQTPLPPKAEGLTIVYDGECPFCNTYVQMLRIKEAAGTVELVDARSQHPVLQAIHEAGIKTDQGVIAYWQGQFYQGDRAMHLLALLSTPVTWFNRLYAFFFRYSWFVRWIYPCLYTARNITLALLGRKRLNPPHTSP